jgi:3-oxoacyl-[acyl-carrier-protein] synthase II
MGEGAAVLVLEELEHAQRRGATVLAELCGYGMSSDAFHITAPDEDGSGAQRAMRLALEDADWISGKRRKVGYVNAHATSTPKGDEIEARAIEQVLNDRRYHDPVDGPSEVFVSSTKGATGRKCAQVDAFM